MEVGVQGAVSMRSGRGGGGGGGGGGREGGGEDRTWLLESYQDMSSMRPGKHSSKKIFTPLPLTI